MKNNKVTLKQLLSREDIQKNIRGNFNVSNPENLNINSFLNDIKGNTLNEEVKINDVIYDFENNLHSDESKNVYLLESRLFNKNGEMYNAYLEIFTSNGDIVTDCIDDVWGYANWKQI